MIKAMKSSMLATPCQMSSVATRRMSAASLYSGLPRCQQHNMLLIARYGACILGCQMQARRCHLLQSAP